MNYSILKDKYLLLDTNILINCSKFPPLFKGFLNKLIDNDITPVIDHTVRFEFLRKADSAYQRTVLEAFLNSLFPNVMELPFNKETVTDAIDFANIYAWKKEKAISLADCFLASAMKKFNEKATNPLLYLATENHKDFPEYVFKRIGIETVERTRTDIHNIGVYEFDNNGFKKEEELYKKQ